jgi:exosome complex component RRP43
MASSSQSTKQNKIDPSVFQRLHPRTYLERFLGEGIRPDGRDPNAWRGVSVNVGETSAIGVSVLCENA